MPIIVSMILQTAEVREMGRYDPGSCAGLFGFKSGTIVPSFHWSGNLPSDQDLFIKCNS